MTFDLQRAKKMAPLALLVSGLMVALTVWTFVGVALPSIADIRAHAPSLRITSVAFLGPLGALLFLMLALTAIARAFYANRFALFAEKSFVWIGLVFIVLIPVFSVGGSFLQHHYLPKLGYHYCNKLSGNPALRFNDWVRDPAWCVYQKDHDWVREQAAAQGAAKSR